MMENQNIVKYSQAKLVLNTTVSKIVNAGLESNSTLLKKWKKKWSLFQRENMV